LSDDWRLRLRQPRPITRIGTGTATGMRTEMAQVFLRLVQADVIPAFREVARAAGERGINCTVDLELRGVQPRAMFVIRPSGRSWRYQLDSDGRAVRELEGVYYRPLGQRMVWTDIDALERMLTAGYARRAAAELVREHLMWAEAG
jgi:hypothetical protein